MRAYGHGNLIAFEAANCKDDTENAHARCSSSASVVWRWQCSSPTPPMMTSVSTGVCCITQCWVVPSALGRCQGVGHCPVAPSVCGHDPDLHLYQSRCSALSSPIPPASDHHPPQFRMSSLTHMHRQLPPQQLVLSTYTGPVPIARCLLFRACLHAVLWTSGPTPLLSRPWTGKRPSSGRPFLSTLKCWV